MQDNSDITTAEVCEGMQSDAETEQVMDKNGTAYTTWPRPVRTFAARCRCRSLHVDLGSVLVPTVGMPSCASSPCP